jgi:hypothetical protein
MSPERLHRLRGQRGPQRSKPLKVPVTLRLDPDTRRAFQETRAGLAVAHQCDAAQDAETAEGGEEGMTSTLLSTCRPGP